MSNLILSESIYVCVKYLVKSFHVVSKPPLTKNPDAGTWVF